jgi:hypothetical protein
VCTMRAEDDVSTSNWLNRRPPEGTNLKAMVAWLHAT